MSILSSVFFVLSSFAGPLESEPSSDEDAHNSVVNQAEATLPDLVLVEWSEVTVRRRPTHHFMDERARALLANIEAFDVTVEMTVDAKGRVNHTRLVEGPLEMEKTVRFGAKRYRFEPRVIEGQPTPFRVQTTIKYTSGPPPKIR